MDSSHSQTTGKNIIPNFKADCQLCQLAAAPHAQADFVCELKNVVVTRGPFAQRWQGALQVTAKRHVKDPSQLKYPHFIHTQAELYLLEGAIRRATQAKHMNVVKFGNVVDHLHWHLIPRFAHEIHAQKTPWELSGFTHEELFHTLYTGSRDELYASILEEYATLQRERSPAFFATAFFIRPRDPASRINFLQNSLVAQHKLIQASPNEFECFLMQRNYLDFAWDSFGGEADPEETPRQTLLRELHEELGWTVSDALEVTRQWDRGVLRGFCYLVTPAQGQLLQVQPDRTPCFEVKQAAWIPLSDLLANQSKTYSEPLCGRARAIVLGMTDFFST